VGFPDHLIDVERVIRHSFDRFDSPRFNAVVDGLRDFAIWVLSRASMT